MRRSPLLRFAAIGALLFVADRWWMDRAAVDAAVGKPRIVLSGAELDRLRREAAARGSAAGAANAAPFINDAIDEEILYRAALARGLEAGDAVIRRRLMQNMRFLAAPDAATEALYGEARDLRLDRTDTVIRRRLVQQMRALLEAEVAEPSEDDLARYLDAHRDRFTPPGRVRISQVFLSARRRGPALAETAAATERLARERHLTPLETAGLGDALPIPSDLPWSSESELAAQLGVELAAAAMTMPVGEWSAPLPSAYGLHLLWVHERRAGESPRLAQVRAAVREAWRRERAAAALRTALDHERAQYEIDLLPDGRE